MTQALAFTRRHRVAAALGLALLATGCAMRTPFDLPPGGLPTAWTHGAAAEAEAPAEILVPQAFRQDAKLHALLTVVQEANRELAASAVKLRRAQLQAGLADNALWPQPSGGLNADAGKPLRHGGDTTRSHGTNLSLAYEVDVWNRLGTLRDMAQWETRATGEDRRSVRISLLATAGSLYFRLGLLNDRVRIGEANLADARRTLALVQVQYAHGAASALELAEARQTLQGQEVQFAQLIQQRVEARNALAVLADGRDLSGYEPQALPDYAVAPLPAGLPAALLSQRPDLRAGEIRLRRLLASVDTTRTSFYPGLSLTASAGSSSSEIRNLLSNPVGTLAANLALPFLNLGRARLTTAIARTEFDEAALVFQQSLLTAFTEVDNALSAGVQLHLEQRHLQAALDDARIAERLYELRYREGAIGLRDWISAQDRRRQAEVAALENRYNRFGNAITVLKALGTPIR